MKTKRILAIVAVLALLVSGCGNNIEKDKNSVRKPVKVTEVKEETAVSEMTYMGIVTPLEVKKLSFKSAGKIKDINVVEGQKIITGQVLASIDTKDLGYSVDAAKAAKDAAKAQYDKAINGATEEDIILAKSNVSKAENAFSYAKDSYDRVQKLYDAGGLSNHELEGAKLELDIREEELNAARTMLTQVEKGAREEDIEILKAQISQADTDLNYKTSVIKDAVMKSDMDGYVMTLTSKPGELIGSGYPVIVLGSSTNIVKFGLCPDDATAINIGDPIEIEVSDKTYKGKITSIDQIMDEETRTFITKGEIEDSVLPSGAIAKVHIPIGEYNAINIPLTCVMRGNFDYVYVVEGEQAKKKQIELSVIRGDKVEVTGLTKGDMLIIEGMKKVNDGDTVEIIK